MISMKFARMLRRFIKPHEAAFLAIALIVLAGLSLSNITHRQSLASVEVQFTDSSAHGLQIVPASCPSYPHYSGDCSATTTRPTTAPTQRASNSGQARAARQRQPTTPATRTSSVSTPTPNRVK